jgi:putative DNA primase/helicase
MTRFQNDISKIPRDEDHGEPGQPTGHDPAQYFGGNGLLHLTLRNAVLDLGPIVTGPARTLWRYRDGVWLPDGADEVRRRVRQLLGQRLRKSHTDGLIADLEADEPFITDIQPTQWINCANGLLDWRTLELHPHSPLVPTTYQLTVPWDPAAHCPTVDAWLGDTAPEDAVELIWEVFGVAVYPDQPFHKAVLLLGPGRNGKGTLLRLITGLIGAQHVSSVSLHDLGENRWAVADLFGKVANVAGDLDARGNIRTDVFKRATGQDLLTGEHKYGQRFSFTSRATMIFAANEPPGTADHSTGYISRFVVVPFTRLTIKPGEEDSSIEQALHAELCGVLVKAVHGLRRAMERGGFDLPASVSAANEEYRDVTDPMRTFIGDCVDITGAYIDTVPRAAVYTRYSEWCAENGHRQLGANRFWGQFAATDSRIDMTRASGQVRLVGGVQLIMSWR